MRQYTMPLHFANTLAKLPHNLLECKMLLNYKQTGTGPVVVLMHGLFGSLENLNVIVKTLSEQFTVINVDLRNHGSSFHADEMNYASMAQDIVSLLNHLKIEKAHIIGHSMGGKVAMQVAMLNEALIDKLIVLDIAPVTYHSRHDKIIQALKAVANDNVNSRNDADSIMKSYIDEVGVRQFLLKSLAKNESGYQWKFNLSTISDNYSEIISNINATHSCQCATLFIKGNNSDYILPEHREAIVSLFPNSKAKVIHGAGHWLHAEKPEAVNRSIIDFLQ
jgi:esterase